nr:hypothetical protein [Anaerolineae bacterium]
MKIVARFPDRIHRTILQEAPAIVPAIQRSLAQAEEALVEWQGRRFLVRRMAERPDTYDRMEFGEPHPLEKYL